MSLFVRIGMEQGLSGKIVDPFDLGFAVHEVITDGERVHAAPGQMIQGFLGRIDQR